MPQLPDRPDIDHLRQQARELHRAATTGDAEALRRLQHVTPRVTLWGAQLALAREHGFTSWARLKAEVERRRTAISTSGPGQPVVVRPVASIDELARAFDVAGGQMTPAISHDDRRFADLARRFALDRSLMQVVDAGDSIVGAALAFRGSPHGVGLRIIGLQPTWRGRGLGRRLMEAVEVEAMHLGVGGIALGGVTSATRGFYTRIGYQGRGSMMSKGLPLPGRFLDARLRTVPRPPFRVVV